VPHKVDQAGNFLSFHLPQFFTQDFYGQRLRRDFNHQETVRYKLRLGRQDHIVELLPYEALVSPSYVLETHSSGSGNTLRGRRFDPKPPVMCHYIGRVKDVEGSLAALSTCDGLVSFSDKTMKAQVVD
jgi:hypothetical protein